METNTNYPRPFRAIVWPIAVLLMILLALLVAERVRKVADIYKDKKPDNTISISAEGRVQAVPDVATINAGITVQGKDAKDAQDQASKKINEIIAFVKQQGIPKEDITTQQASIYPRYDYTNGRSLINGYEATQTITIKVKGADKNSDRIGTILSGVTEHGANQVYGVSFSFDDADNLRQEARKIAIAKAKEKAKDLATASGLTLGKVVSVSESGSTGSPYPLPYAVDGFAGRAGDAVAEKSIAPPSVETGSQEITATMTVIFEVK